jgi:hypothetical protein
MAPSDNSRGDESPPDLMRVLSVLITDAAMWGSGNPSGSDQPSVGSHYRASRYDVETFTFVQSREGAEAIWSSNKYGAPILKISAFRAPCSLLDLE